MIVLGIETTCDETACAIVRNGSEILSNVISSQTDLHALFGGVFPELACRRHIDLLLPVIEQAMQEANILPNQIDLIAAAKGPGLIGALLIGLNAAKALALGWQCPFVGINHVEAHLYAAMMPPNRPLFPSIGLVISGGHTFTLLMKGIKEYELIGTTQDDAIGEAFDKVATLLGLSYPGGPQIEALAKKGDRYRFPFKPGKIKGYPRDFSFSGLKTNVLYTIKGPNSTRHSDFIIKEEEKADVAASFQEVALKDVISKTIDAAKDYQATAIYCGGGVSNNQRLKELFSELNSPCPVFYPVPKLTSDNAAMIAGLGFHYYTEKGDPMDLNPLTRIPLGRNESYSPRGRLPG